MKVVLLIEFNQTRNFFSDIYYYILIKNFLRKSYYSMPFLTPEWNEGRVLLNLRKGGKEEREPVQGRGPLMCYYRAILHQRLLCALALAELAKLAGQEMVGLLRWMMMKT